MIELITDGTLEQQGDAWMIRYEESALTGLEGVSTAFCVEPDKITLTRTGKLNSQMVFRLGVSHDSLYQMEFGALMITVCATRIQAQLSQEGGTVDLTYNIDVENNAAGIIEYHLKINKK